MPTVLKNTDMGAEVTEYKDFGVVKWFGGFNSKTNRENDFGFIESIGGEDIFVHKSALAETTTLLEGGKVSFFVIQSGKGPQAKNVRSFVAEKENVTDFVNVLKRSKDRSSDTNVLRYIKELEHVFYSYSDGIKKKIAELLLEDDAGRTLIDKFHDKVGVYRHRLLSVELSDFLVQGNKIDSIPHELILQNEESTCRVICAGAVTHLSRDFLESATLPVLYACGLVNLINDDVLQSRETELRSYLREKFLDPNGESAALYKDIFAKCIERIGGYQQSPVIWSILSELLLKKYLYDRSFEKAAQLFHADSGLERKIDCFILYNLAELLAAGNDLRTTYQIFVHSLWQALTNKQVIIKDQVERILSLFPSCGTLKLARENEDSDPFGFFDPLEIMFEADVDSSAASKMERIERYRNLSCEAVYWEKQKKYLCRGNLCLTPQIQPDLNRSYLDFTVYDWLFYFGVEFWGSEDHQVRDFPIKLAGYLNRLREIMPRLHCRSCNELMIPDFKYSRVKCSVYENGRWIEKDMAAAYRNTVFYCNNQSCHEHNIKYYINHCLGYHCYELIDSRDLKVKCDSGRLICKGCGSCCGEHTKTNPVGFCPECGANLWLFEDPNQVSRFGRQLRFVQCSNQRCDFGISEPALPKKFYLDSCGPIHQVKGFFDGSD